MQSHKAVQKTLIICCCLTAFFTIFYLSKKLITHFFIAKFTHEKPYVAAIHAQSVEFIKYYHTVGEIKAANRVELSPSIGAKVSAIFCKANQSVKKNQLLVQLEDSVESSLVKLYDADYQLQKKLHLQYQTLWRKHAISQTDYLKSLTELKKAKASYRHAQAQWELKKIRAPFNGVVGIPNIYPGQFVNPGQKNLLELIQLKPLYVDFYLPEHYYDKMHLKDNLTLNHHLNASIVAIEPLSKQLAHTIHVRALLEKTRNAHFIPGQFVKLQIPVSHKITALRIPISAMVNSPKGSAVFVAHYSKADHCYRVTEQIIQIKHQFKEKIDIHAPITEKDWIIHAGTQKLSDGQLINLQKNIAGV